MAGFVLGWKLFFQSLVLLSVPILSERIGELYGEDQPPLLSMPWLGLLYLPCLLFVADSIVTKTIKGSLLRYYSLRHCIYIILMLAVFLL